MSDFDPKELRRLSEAAPGDTWHADTAPWFGLRWGVRRVHDDGKALLSCNENTPNQDERVAKLIAYLGTHRDRIIAMLEAADALASILQHEAMSDVALAALDVYEEAKGA